MTLKARLGGLYNFKMKEHSRTRPTVGITIGDAAGIGPEIVVKALAGGDDLGCRAVAIGDRRCLKRTAIDLGTNTDFINFDPVADHDGGSIEVYDLANLPEKFGIGTDAGVTGKASAENIEAAVGLFQRGHIDAICTAPISKTAVALGGYDFPGHTEFLARLTGTDEFAMSFFADDLRVVLLSTHVSLRKALDEIKRHNLIELIRFSDKTLAHLLGRRVKIAVAGLNPHASEGGMFGQEETNEIIPAVEYCRDTLGIDVTGPYSADTLFLRCMRAEFDACIALYHDQATIAVKSLAFGSAVNVTLGLPVVRTSVDHGTAYDIAGRGIAESGSLVAAIRLAGELVRDSR
jgi:4-phospho-D-threonate 3-dehydrogenase / 4-phospho-D-erythronate 3-dehydrogenase